jgi:hypothetical protein
MQQQVARQPQHITVTVTPGSLNIRQKTSNTRPQDSFVKRLAALRYQAFSTECMALAAQRHQAVPTKEET